MRDDLEQVARIALIHAADRFDPSRNRPFVAFARATIIGELKRHLRDRSWLMQMPRSLHDAYLVVMGAVDELTQELGRSPRFNEVAARTGLTEDRVVEAMDVCRPLSLDATVWAQGCFEPGVEDDTSERLEDQVFLADLIAPLSEHQRRIVQLRFVDGLTQSEIAHRLGVSQMCISRTLAKVLRQMRAKAEALLSD
jgi:RNA polymerase sigma-B factor